MSMYPRNARTTNTDRSLCRTASPIAGSDSNTAQPTKTSRMLIVAASRATTGNARRAYQGIAAPTAITVRSAHRRGVARPFGPGAASRRGNVIRCDKRLCGLPPLRELDGHEPADAIMSAERGEASRELARERSPLDERIVHGQVGIDADVCDRLPVEKGLHFVSRERFRPRAFQIMRETPSERPPGTSEEESPPCPEEKCEQRPPMVDHELAAAAGTADPHGLGDGTPRVRRVMQDAPAVHEVEHAVGIRQRLAIGDEYVSRLDPVHGQAF